MDRVILKTFFISFLVGSMAWSGALIADDDTAQPNTGMTDNAAWQNRVEGEEAQANVAEPNPVLGEDAQPNVAQPNPVMGEDAQPNIAEPNVGATDNAAQPNVDLSGY